MSVRPISPGHSYIDEAKGVSFVPNQVENEEVSSLPLEGGDLARFNNFFRNRTYTYSTELYPLNQPPVKLEFEFPLVPFLQECVNKLIENGISVNDVFVKGGTVCHIVAGSKKKLADLDMGILIEPPKSQETWSLAEQTIFNCLADFAKIEWSDKDGWRTYFQNGKKLFSDKITSKTPQNIFFYREARKNRFFNEKGQFALYTILTFFKGAQQCFDIQVSGKEDETSCFSSVDATRISFGDVRNLGVKPALRIIGGYKLPYSLDLMKKGKYIAKVSNVKQIFRGLRGFCHISTRGFQPLHMEFETKAWESFLNEYNPPAFGSFYKDLLRYLDDHYLGDPTGKTFYLINYLELISRCNEEKKPSVDTALLNKTIIALIYQIAGVKRPNSFDKAKDEIQLLETFFYLKKMNERPPFSHNKKSYVFFENGEGDHLLIESPLSRFETTLPKIAEGLDPFPLLKSMTRDMQDPHQFMVKKIQAELRIRQKIEEQKKKAQDRVPTPEAQVNEDLTFEQFDEDLSEFLDKEQVKESYDNLMWALDRKDFIPSDRLSPLLQTALERFCSLRSVKYSSLLMQALIDRKVSNMTSYLLIYVKNLNIPSDIDNALRFIELVKKGGGSIDQELVKSLFLAVLKKYPDRIDTIYPLFADFSIELQRDLGEIIAKDPKQFDRPSILSCFNHLYQKNRLAFFIDEINGGICVESIRLYIDLLSAKNKWSEVVDFYKEIAPSIVKSGAFTELFKRVILPISSSKSSDSINLIKEGLNQILERNLIDNHSLGAIALIARNMEIVKALGETFNRCAQLVEATFKPNEEAKDALQASEKERSLILAAYKAVNKLSKQAVNKSKIETAENLAYSDLFNKKNWSDYFDLCKNHSKVERFFERLEQVCKDHPKNIQFRLIFDEYLDKNYSITHETVYLEKKGNNYAELIGIDPTNDGWLYDRAKILFRSKKFELAIQEMKRAVKLKPQFIEYVFELAKYQRYLFNSSDESVKTLKDFYNSIPKDESNKLARSKTFSEIAWIFSTFAENKKADTFYKLALTMDDTNEANLKRYGQFIACLASDANMFDTAAALLGKYLIIQTNRQEDPTSLIQDFTYQAKVYLKSSTPEKACTPLELSMFSRPELKYSEDYLKAVTARLTKYALEIKKYVDLEIADAVKVTKLSEAIEKDKALIKEIQSKLYPLMHKKH
jgi:hypothetical protein